MWAYLRAGRSRGAGLIAPALVAITGHFIGVEVVQCAIRSYLATAARHGISGLDALTRAFRGSPWIPETG
jgi:hypothetical protein